ncbi:MAG TPA: hypothetical protein VE133_13720, partial [Candidatus Sulfotelmatobacter sp.]|nr:hypothetical protein [Candidatus Sulfotelmatobacter sp.]
MKAEIIAFARPDEALDLLSVPPPRELSSGEFAGSRKLIQGLAYGLRHEYPQAKSSFEEAGHLINNNPDLLVRLALNQAYVFYLAKNKTAAEEQYSSAIDLAHKYGLPRMEATAHVSLGKLLMDQEIYDRAIN